MPKRITREEAAATLAAFKECNHDVQDTCRKLGIGPDTLRARRRAIKTFYPDLEVPDPVVRPPREADEELLQQALDAYAINKTLAAGARATGTNPSTFRMRILQAEARGMRATPQGNADAMKARPLDLPTFGAKRYILTCAQNNTLLHDPTWRALLALADFYEAEVKVATLTYVHSHEGSAKRGTAKQDREMWYDPRIEPYVSDEMLALAPNLIWNGHTNIIPTATDPLTGWDNYNFRASSIFPHVKCAMKSIPTIRNEGTKLQYTTGTVTQRNYTQKKAGQRAEFDHVYGGLLVEVTPEGSWFVRQLNVDSRGELYDLDIKVTASGAIEKHKGVEAIQFGDVHVAQLEDDMVQSTWGPGGMVDELRPKYQFMHDILDFESRSHHNLRDPFKMFELHVKGRASVEDEIRAVSDLLQLAKRPRCKTVIVQSNHDLHFERWLRETSWKNDPLNAALHARATAAFLEAIQSGEPFNALRWALDTYAPVKGLTWADPDDGYLILRDGSGGIEMGLHGDLGPNGSRGSLRNLSRLGRKVCIGHSHSAGIHNGAYQSGVKAKLGMDYARGAPSSWTQSDIVVQPNGKRQIITWWCGRYRA